MCISVSTSWFYLYDESMNKDFSYQSQENMANKTFTFTFNDRVCSWWIQASSNFGRISVATDVRHCGIWHANEGQLRSFADSRGSSSFVCHVFIPLRSTTECAAGGSMYEIGWADSVARSSFACTHAINVALLLASHAVEGRFHPQPRPHRFTCVITFCLLRVSTLF